MTVSEESTMEQHYHHEFKGREFSLVLDRLRRHGRRAAQVLHNQNAVQVGEELFSLADTLEVSIRHKGYEGSMRKSKIRGMDSQGIRGVRVRVTANAITFALPLLLRFTRSS